MNKTIYVVIRKGVYRHEILYISDNRAKAMKIAEQAIRNEDDNYHSLQMLECLSDKLMKDGKLITEFVRIGQVITREDN